MRRVWRIPPVFLLLATILAIPQIGLAQSADGPDVIFQAAADALGKGNVDTSLAYFADDAFVKEVTPFTIKNVTTYTGKQQIRKWLQKLFDSNTLATTIGTTQVKGNTLSFLIKVGSDDLKKAGVDSIVANQEVVVGGGKIKSITITPTSLSIPDLQKAGYTGGATTQGQGGAPAPSSAPATGFGSTSPDRDWLLTLLLALVALISFSSISLLLIRHRSRR